MKRNRLHGFLTAVLFALVLVVALSACSKDTFTYSDPTAGENMKLFTCLAPYDVVKENFDTSNIDKATDIILSPAFGYDRNGEVTEADDLSACLKKLKMILRDDQNLYAGIDNPQYVVSSSEAMKNAYKENVKLRTEAYTSGALETNLIDSLKDYNFKGLFFNYEDPSSKADKSAFDSFIVSFNEKSEKKYFIGVFAYSDCFAADDEATDKIDFIVALTDNLFDKEGNYSTTDMAKDEAIAFLKAGIDSKKLILQLPFNGKSPDNDNYVFTYKEYVKKLDERGKVYDRATDLNVSFNIPEVVYYKTLKAMDMGLYGICADQYSYDISSDSEKSLFNAVQKAIDERWNGEKPTEKQEEETEKKVTNMNLLTGEYTLSKKAIGKRPMAVMINNIKQSLPQYGIGKADIMYEVVTEGGITRMMAIYGDYTKVPNVCSIRSCRYYYPIFAMGYDAVYFCFGGNKTLGYPTLKRLKMDYFDGNSYGTLLFARDMERRQHYALEHTGYLKGGNIPAAMEKEHVRSDLLENKTGPAFSFNSKVKRLSDTKCNNLRVAFSAAYYSDLKYDEKTKTYFKYHSGNRHMDSATGKQLEYTNVFSLETDVHVYKDGKIMEVDWKGGTGYYASKGTVVEITWKKPTEKSYIKFFNKETGKELKVNPGKSYIAVCNKGQTSLS